MGADGLSFLIEEEAIKTSTGLGTCTETKELDLLKQSIFYPCSFYMITSHQMRLKCSKK